VRWFSRKLRTGTLREWRDLARESLADVNDGIVSAAGVAEGFVRAGAANSALLFTGIAVILAGGLAAGGVRYGEERLEADVNRARLEAERVAIDTDPAGELAELTGIYQE
jgi:vacuolar iron transporter family protein